MYQFKKHVAVISSGAVAGKLESEGPLKSYFDIISNDSKFNMDTWEKAESEMIRISAEIAFKKASIKPNQVDAALFGDLTNQCNATTFGFLEHRIPLLGIYGACSTYALSIGMAGLLLQGHENGMMLCGASSHYSSAERQYRFPLEYGCQRTPTSQTTVTGAGTMLLSNHLNSDIYVREFLPGIIIDAGIHDVNNMGAAMAPAAFDTISKYFKYTNTSPSDFDLILTGDLGFEGYKILCDMLNQEGYLNTRNVQDCGMMIYDREKQAVNAGGSGCGCSATVVSGYIISAMKKGIYQNVLLIGTGALLNATSVLQKEPIPSIAHLVRITKEVFI